MSDNKQFKQTRLVIVLIAVIIILIFIVGVLIGERHNIKPTTDKNERVVDKTEKETKQEEDEKIEKIPLNSKYLDDVPKFPEHLCGGIQFPIQSTHVHLENLSDNDKFNLLVTAYNKNIKVEGNPDYKPFIITEEEIKKYFADTSFMDVIKEEGLDSGKTKTAYYTAEPLHVEYKNNKFYFSKLPTGCEGPAQEGYRAKLIEANKNDKELVMSYKVYYLKAIYDEDTGNITNDIYEYEGSSKPKYKGLDYDELEALDFSEFDTYDMYFDITNGNIRFEKMIYNGPIQSTVDNNE